MIPAIVAKLRTYFPEVDRVADSAKPITVEISEADCAGGDRKKPETCAMARACVRDLGCDGILVWASVAWIIKGRTAIKYMVPQALSREIAIFDRGAEFAPGTYHLRPVTRSSSVTDAARARRRGAQKRRATHGKTKTAFVYHKTANIRVSTKARV